MKRELLVTLAAVLIACGGGPSSTSGASVDNASADRTKAVSPMASSAPDAGNARHHVHVHELRGTEDRDLDPALSPTVQRQLEGCHGASGGKFRVRVRRDGGRLDFEAEPSPSLDPTERACVLEALRRDEVARALSTGATVAPTGFTSLLTIEW